MSDATSRTGALVSESGCVCVCGWLLVILPAVTLRGQSTQAGLQAADLIVNRLDVHSSLSLCLQ